MTRFWTIAHDDKVSNASHEHLTLAFHDDGTIAVRTKTVSEGAHMRDTYESCGSYGRWDTGHRWVEFDSSCTAFDMASVAMQREWNVTVLNCNASDSDWGHISFIECDGNVTDPDTLRGMGRNKDADADETSATRKRNGNSLMRFGGWNATRVVNDKALARAKAADAARN